MIAMRAGAGKNLISATFCAFLFVPALCGGQPKPGGWWGVGWTKVPTVVIVAQDDDPRIQTVREAVEFWNRTFVELGSPFRLGVVKHVSGAVSADELQALSAKVLARTGLGEFSEAIRGFPGDLIVALSDGDFVSFAARWPASERALVGIRTQRTPPLSFPNVTRNIVAHELGHAIGLGHNEDPAMLMCGRPAPCRPDAFVSRAERFFPLTSADKAVLRGMYPANWESR